MLSRWRSWLSVLPFSHRRVGGLCQSRTLTRPCWVRLNFDLICDHRTLAPATDFVKRDLFTVKCDRSADENDPALDQFDPEFTEMAPMAISDFGRQLIQGSIQLAQASDRGHHGCSGLG